MRTHTGKLQPDSHREGLMGETKQRAKHF